MLKLFRISGIQRVYEKKGDWGSGIMKLISLLIQLIHNY